MYLHDVRDLWFERKGRPSDQGRCQLFRFADDLVVGFERNDEAAAFEQALKERRAKFGLERAPGKTQRLRFGRRGGRDNDRFDFLGFEFYWEADRKGRPTVKRRTARKKLHAGIQRMKQWIKSHRHLPVKQWLKKLASKRRGTWNYDGLIGNSRSLAQFR